MSDNPFEMFNSADDYVTWDRYHEQIESINLSEPDRERVRGGLSYFRSIMGEDFLKRIAHTQHSFFPMLTNAAPRERIFLAERAEHLRELETASNFDSLKARIASAHPDEFAEGISVLSVAHKLHSRGFSISFEPKVAVTQKDGTVRQKRPDIKCINQITLDEIYIEVSQLLVGDAQRKSRRTFQALFNIWDNLTWKYRNQADTDDPLGKGILPNIKFYRAMTDEELETFAKSVDYLGKFVLDTDAFAALTVKDVISIGIAPPFNHEAVNEWAKEQGLNHPPVEGPPIQTEEVDRAIRKIFADDDKTAKKWQLPDKGPGIVVLNTNKNLLLFTHDIRYIIGGLEEALAQEPKLNYIILTLQFDSLEEAGTVLSQVGDHRIARHSHADGRQGFAVLIRNGQCKTSLTADSDEKIGCAFG